MKRDSSIDGLNYSVNYWMTIQEGVRQWEGEERNGGSNMFRPGTGNKPMPGTTTMPGTKKRVALFDEQGRRIKGLENQALAEIALAKAKVNWGDQADGVAKPLRFRSPNLLGGCLYLASQTP